MVSVGGYKKQKQLRTFVFIEVNGKLILVLGSGYQQSWKTQNDYGKEKNWCI